MESQLNVHQTAQLHENGSGECAPVRGRNLVKHAAGTIRFMKHYIQKKGVFPSF